MDKNQVAGLVLISAMFMAYIFFFKPPAQVPDTKTVEQQVTTPTSKETPEVSASASKDSLETVYAKEKLGLLSNGSTGTEELTVLENEDIKVTFSSLGGSVQQVLLKKYRTADKKPLYLITPESSTTALLVNTPKGSVDLKKLYYTSSTKVLGDTTILTYKLDLGAGKFITQTYTFPKEGYQIGYKINASTDYIQNSPAKFYWKVKLQKFEKDLGQSRSKTTVNYYQTDKGYDYLSRSIDTKEEETLNSPIEWVAMQQKFFTSGIIANHPFEKGHVEASVPNDSSVVKVLTADLTIPSGDLKTGKASFKYYFGPNHYQTLKKVAQGFERNVDLGYPVINWINRFIVIPTFNFLDNALGGMKWKYGLIIFILALLVKIITLPLSFKSYISMAKMKVMKPELDELKAKYGSDTQKIQSEQMALYSKVGINPLSGCIPVVLSMPVLLALFSFFPNSIELRQQPFLWAHDLSTYDAPIKLAFSIPFYGSHISFFTILMTISSIAYTYYNNQINTATGPMKSIGYVMPVVFMFVLNSYPAALSFYYFVSNILNVGQQQFIKRFVNEDKIKATLEENKKKNAAGGGGGKKSKFMQRVEEAMKAKEEMNRQQKKKK